MENRKAVLDLKDVPPPPPHHIPLPSPPPPPHHIPSSQPSHPFSLTPMSLLPPCLPPAPINLRLSIPITRSASIPIPICNGCGTSSESVMLVPSTSVDKTGRKYGSPENTGPENIPPVGVFWDIENCSVPSGRSAAVVVERIRSRFFQGHREAEFICVCDISKESKAVIQELNNSQVTVAHINATAKNAADDKLRQSLRRFAETHAAPATVILVSSDVNFASELSDLRHRHGFRIILIHGNQTSSALLQHAHCHVPFQEITADLPPCMLVKSQPSFSLLFVRNLPVNCDKSLQNAVKHRLRRLSDNCGGKVLGISQGTAVLRFSSPEAASRACKRMENEDVYGHRISLSSSPGPRDDASPEPELQPRFKLTEKLPSKNCCINRQRLKRSIDVKPRPIQASFFLNSTTGLKHTVSFFARMESRKSNPRMAFHHPDKGNPAAPEETLVLENRSKPLLAGESANRKSKSCTNRREDANPQRVTESPVEQKDGRSVEFQTSIPLAFSKLNFNLSFSPPLPSRGSWSSR
uniref:Meiosis regulator and mRNA stability factor 1 n=1 Tax=Tetraodon nigroviridis TaxID=99883 RepID=H3CL67_TETNG